MLWSVTLVLPDQDILCTASTLRQAAGGIVGVCIRLVIAWTVRTAATSCHKQQQQWHIHMEWGVCVCVARLEWGLNLPATVVKCHQSCKTFAQSCLSSLTCVCVSVLSRSVAHITNLYGQKMAFRGGHTASLLHNRYTHKQQIQVHKRRSGRGGQRRSGQCNTPTHLDQDNSALSSVQAQTQANKKNNNSNNDITAPNKMAGTGFVWGSSSSFCSSYFCSFSFCCWSWQIHLGFGLSCSWR